MRALLLLLLCFTTEAFAKSDSPKVWLSWKNDPTSTMTVMWITKKSADSDNLSYHKKNSPNWSKSSGRHWLFPNKKPYIVHKVELKNLEPDSIYGFCVGTDSKEFFLRTMPKNLDSPIRFITGGDAYHNSLKKYRSMCIRAAKENPRFVIIGGDIAYAAARKGGQEEWGKWINFFSCWSKEMKDSENCLIPLLVTIGNHEVTGSFNRSVEDAPFYYTFFEKATYALSFGSYAHFTFLDSNHTLKIKGKQTDWLKNVLQKSAHHKHRFAIYHVGAYPSSGKSNFPAGKLIRKHWVPLFEKYKIHACFESHDHAYKRTHPLIKDKKHKDGIVYFGDGCWGVTPRKPKSSRPYLAHSAQKQNALVVELSNKDRKFWSIDPQGKVIDYYEQSVKNK